MSMRLSVARGMVSLGSARIIVNLLNAGSILILARLLTPRDFGIVAIATSLQTVVTALSDTSFQSVLVQCRDETRAHLDTVWTLQVIRAASIITLFLVAAVPLAHVYSDPRLVPVLMVTGISAAFMDFYNPKISLAMKSMRFGSLTFFQISQKFVGLTVAVGLAIAFKSYWAIIIGTAVGALTASLSSFVLTPYLPRFDLSKVREIWGFSGWLFLNQVCETVNWRFDQLAIGLVAPMAALGRYAIADNLAVIPCREVSLALRGALFPGMATLSGEPERLRRSYLRAQTILPMLTAPAAVGLALVAGPAVRVILGDKWLESIIFVRILALNYAFETLIFAIKPLAMAMGQTKVLFLRQAATLVVRVPAILLGLYLGGLTGAAIGRLASGIFMWLVSLLVPRFLLGLSAWEQIKAHRVTFAGLAVMAAVVSLAKAFAFPLTGTSPVVELLGASLLGGATYAGVLLVVWIASGKRFGPVAEVLDIIRGLLASLRRPARAT